METIELNIDDYDDLLLDSEFLDCLMDAGVENWEGYEEAVRMFEGDDET